MDKSRFERFIAKYNLYGTCESVLITSNQQKATVRCMSADRDFVVIVEDNKSALGTGKYPIFETQKIRSLIGVLGNSFDTTLRYADDDTTPLVLNMNDGVFDVNFALCDESVLPDVPDVEDPKYTLTIPLTQEFVQNFIKAKNALGEVDTFALKTLGNGKIEFAIGDSSINSNLIKIHATSNENVTISPMKFSAKIFKNLLNANKDATSGVMYVSTEDLVKISFSGDDIESTYYLVAK